MTQFLRLLNESEKPEALASVCANVRSGKTDLRHFEVAPESFDAVPGKPFSYWVSEAVRGVFRRFPPFEYCERSAKQGLATSNDFRFVRLWWELVDPDVERNDLSNGVLLTNWPAFAKGGSFSSFYTDLHLRVNWRRGGAEIKEEVDRKYSHIKGYQTYWVVKNPETYFRPGLTWPLRTNGLSFRPMPAGCIYGHKGPAAFISNDEPRELMALSSILNSQPFGLLVSLQLARTELAQSYEVGIIQQTPIPNLAPEVISELAMLARRAWSLKRTLDSISETSHAFALPVTLRAALGNFDRPAIEAELTDIQARIEHIAFDVYGFSEADRAVANQPQGGAPAASIEAPDNGEDEGEDAEVNTPMEPSNTLLSWAVGVAFGHFDWRLATMERDAPSEPDPFDPLPTKSPGMLPDGAAPFHIHAGILVDDPGHRHDLVRLVEDVLARVEIPVHDDLRRWLQKEFFAFHLKRYSRSRRKAPIYWPLATASGSYTLWLYYPSLTSQTIYSVINDFVEPKLAQVMGDIAALRNKGSTARSRDEEKRFESFETLELELIELREQLMKIAPSWHPKHVDGVQITAAPLWPLFRYKPWQKILKDTWSKLEKGDYDWAHLAMTYWSTRIRRLCETDKSLAIAHDLEDSYIETVGKKKTKRNRS